MLLRILDSMVHGLIGRRGVRWVLHCFLFLLLLLFVRYELQKRLKAQSLSHSQKPKTLLLACFLGFRFWFCRLPLLLVGVLGFSGAFFVLLAWARALLLLDSGLPSAVLCAGVRRWSLIKNDSDSGFLFIKYRVYIGTC